MLVCFQIPRYERKCWGAREIFSCAASDVINHWRVTRKPEVEHQPREPPSRRDLAEAGEIPSTLREIGRLREITFRAAGEGTRRVLDLDEFDAHYLHLFVWNEKKQEVAVPTGWPRPTRCAVFTRPPCFSTALNSSSGWVGRLNSGGPSCGRNTNAASSRFCCSGTVLEPLSRGIHGIACFLVRSVSAIDIKPCHAS